MLATRFSNYLFQSLKARLGAMFLFKAETDYQLWEQTFLIFSFQHLGENVDKTVCL